jgi:hypothetical protein
MEGNLFIFSSDLMNNKDIKFLFFLLIFTIALDRGLGLVYGHLYFSKKSRNDDRFIHSILGTDEDILIFGSSRALHHYDPYIIKDYCKMSCFNAGSGGQNIYFHLALLEAAIERYIPKIVILELLTIDFEKTPPQWDTEKLGELLPFINMSDACYKAVLRRGKSEKIKKISFIYPFN